MKSEQSSKRARSGLKRNRTLGRGCSYRTFEDGDLKWFWAAYNKGGFEDVLEPDLTQEVFTEAILAIITAFLEQNNDFMVLEANVAGQGVAPVGVVMVAYVDLSAWPHAHWFSWATNRNKLECSVLFLRDLKREAMPFIMAKPELVPFYSHLARYGLLKRSGTISNYRDGEKSIFYHGVV